MAQRASSSATYQDGSLRIALPGDRQMEDETVRFLAECGLAVRRPSARQYIGTVTSIKGVSVLFQRSADIPGQLDEGAVDMAILGYERFLESRDDEGDSTVVIKDLGYSRCQLVIAVPNSWTHVTYVKDLARLAKEAEERGGALRVATKYHRLVGRFLDERGIKGYRSIQVSGGVEAAPLIDIADIVCDIASSGSTLRENNLKVLEDGVIVQSTSCLVANKRLLKESPAKLEATKTVIELIEARLRAEGFYHIIANVQGESHESVARLVMKSPDLGGMQGPTVSNVVSKTGEPEKHGSLAKPPYSAKSSEPGLCHCDDRLTPRQRRPPLRQPLGWA
ncbi:MAG: phosphoribosyltransferase [Dehalococcoidia bacterium]|nr:phosphoribosyltransferase [Dehalococcoidia bacterium]